MAAKRTVTLHIRVEEPLAGALKVLADRDERKISPYVARVLRRHVEAEGLSLEAPAAKPSKRK